MNYGYYETENDCGRQCRQAVQTRPCGGIPADLTFLLLFWSSKKVEENYIHTDHLGSYCAITNAKYKVVQRNCFDPWGNYAFDYYKSTIVIIKSAGDTIPGLTFPITARGFTGHEHYPYFKIINMNGRLYDPVIARFFSPDKYVANSSFTQDFNRYAYARNCPLMYTDPDGELLWFIPIIIGAAIAAATYTVSVAISPGGFQNWDWGQFLFSTMLGAASGVFSMGVGGVIGGALATVGIEGIAGGAITGAAVGLFSGTVTGLMQYATTGDANMIWKSALIGTGMGAVTGAIGGMADALHNDKNVWLGRDRAMGRGNWSFKNTDLPENACFEGNTHYGERSRGMSQTRNARPLKSYEDAKNKHDIQAIARRENWICADKGQGYPAEQLICTKYVYGRGYGKYWGWVPEGHQLHIDFDGQNILTLSPGNYSETIIPIPSSTTFVHVYYTGSYPSYMQGHTIVTSAFRFYVYGVNKF